MSRLNELYVTWLEERVEELEEALWESVHGPALGMWVDSDLTAASWAPETTDPIYLGAVEPWDGRFVGCRWIYEMRGDEAAIMKDSMPIGWGLLLRQVGFPDTSSMIAAAVEGYELEWDGYFVGGLSVFRLNDDGTFTSGRTNIENSLNLAQVGLTHDVNRWEDGIMDAVNGYVD